MYFDHICRYNQLPVRKTGDAIRFDQHGGSETRNAAVKWGHI